MTECVYCWLTTQPSSPTEGFTYSPPTLPSSDGDSEETAARVAALRALGVEERLHALEHDECLAVKERAGTAINQLRALAAAEGGDAAMEAV